MEGDASTRSGRSGRPRQDLTGSRFGMLTVHAYVPETGKWQCLCDCGTVVCKTTGHLNAGTTVSCGCIRRTALQGRRFGMLTVQGKTDRRRSGAVLWECLCDCGTVTYKTTGDLNSGAAVSCGCSWRKPAVQQGQRFGRLVAQQPTHRRAAKSVVWRCSCDCGNTVDIRATLLTSGHTTSCGCIKRELSAQLTEGCLARYRSCCNLR